MKLSISNKGPNAKALFFYIFFIEFLSDQFLVSMVYSKYFSKTAQIFKVFFGCLTLFDNDCDISPVSLSPW